ncbi:MAG: hypothetical protein V1774_07490 [Candidatus Eisenbacteria bacterium]
MAGREQRPRESTQPYRPGPWARAWEGLFGYIPAGRWRLYRSRDEDRRRGSVPERIPIRAGAARWRKGGKGGKAGERISHDHLARQAAAFAEEHPRHPLSPELRRFVEKTPLAAQVESAWRERRFGEAEGPLRAILALDAGDCRARMLLAHVLLLRGDVDGAGEHLDRCGHALDEDAEFHLLRGRHHEARGETSVAKRCYRRALEIRPDQGGAMERLSALGEMVEIFLGTLDDPERAYLPMADYEKLIEEGWLREERGLPFFIERSGFHLRHGHPRLAYRAALKAEECIGDLRDPEKEPSPGAPLLAEALAARCRAEVALGRGEDAGSSLARLEQIAPRSELALSCRGHLSWFQGRREEAAAAIRESIRMNPNRVEDILVALDPAFPGRAEDLWDALERLENEHPQSYALKSIMASVLLAKGDWERGVALAVESVRLGAGGDSLIEITGRLGREGRDADIDRIVTAAGGGGGFSRAIRCCASIWRSVMGEAATGRPPTPCGLQCSRMSRRIPTCACARGRGCSAWGDGYRRACPRLD